MDPPPAPATLAIMATTAPTTTLGATALAATAGSFSSDEVARYYDANTGSFLRFGQGGSVGAIHRAVWGPGVQNRREAFDSVHRLLHSHLAQLGRLQAPATVQVLDLGCGVGATLSYLLTRTSARGVGITNSQVQADLARRNARDASLGCRLQVLEGDFCAPRSPAWQCLAGRVDLAYAIEAFVQAADPGAFFHHVSQVLKAGGRLAVCDDFLAQPAVSPHEERWLAEFRRGWHVTSLLTPARADELARGVGLEPVQDLDLSAGVETRRLRDRAIALLVGLARLAQGVEAVRSFLHHPRWLSLVGGHALERCLRAGLLHYRFRVWERR